MSKKIILTIIDGFGISNDTYGNPVKKAYMPNISSFIEQYPHTFLEASEEFVGLSKGEPGSSEVGHMTIGCGYNSIQPFSFIENKIKTRELYHNKVILDAFDYAIKNNKKIHLIGQLSDAGIHSHMHHLYPFLEIAKDKNFKDIFIHCITDGRDSPAQSATKFIKELEDKIVKLTVGNIASISGRFYSMDRTGNYDRIKKAYDCLVSNIGESFVEPIDYINKQYDFLKNTSFPVTDEYILPAYNSSLNGRGLVEDGDVMIHINLRADRAIEFSTILSDMEYQEKYLNNSKKVDLKYISLLFYSNSVKGDVIYRREALDKTFSKWLEINNYSQLRVAETEKFAHVTFFFDGTNKYDDIEKPKLKNCDCILIPSLPVKSYSEYPEMSANEITDCVIEKNIENKYDFTLVNYANCDLVGHTANFDACVKALECVDKNIGRLINWCKENDIIFILTADHGNIEQVYKKDGTLNPSHTLNKVPFVVSDKSIKLKPNGRLANIAATLCELLGQEKESFMEESLINNEIKN